MALTQQAQTLADTFTAGLSADQRANFESALQNSPALVTQINTAVASGDLTGFTLLPAGTNAGGQYDPVGRTVQLPESILTTPQGGSFDPGELTFVMGHEVQHAINGPVAAAALTTFANDTNAIAASGQAVHDYTAPVAAMLAVNRTDEATAHIAGFNATVDMVRNGTPSPSLEDIYRANPGRMGDFINVAPGNPATYSLRSGLTLNADMTMTPDAANTEAMGRHFYDRPANVTGIGHNGDSDYQNYYAATLVSHLVNLERAYAPQHAQAGLSPQLTLDMTALRINEPQLERNGLAFTAGGDHAYYDSSTQPPTQGRLHDTQGTYQHIPMPAQQSAPEAHPALRDALDALERSPNIGADHFGTDRERVAAGIALHAAEHQIALHHVVLDKQGSGLLLVQGELTDPAAKRSPPLAVDDALRTDPATLPQRLDALQALQPTPSPSLGNRMDNPQVEAPQPMR